MKSLSSFSKEKDSISMKSLSSFSKDRDSISITTAGLKRKREQGLVRKLKKLEEEQFLVGDLRTDIPGDPFEIKKRKVRSQLEDLRSSAVPVGDITIYVSMSSRMCDSEMKLSEDNGAYGEKRKITLWPSWARVSGSSRSRAVTFPAEMLEEMTDFVEGYGCTWQEE
jgi:hypothetical protein